MRILGKADSGMSKGTEARVLAVVRRKRTRRNANGQRSARRRQASAARGPAGLVGSMPYGGPGIASASAPPAEHRAVFPGGGYGAQTQTPGGVVCGSSDGEFYPLPGGKRPYDVVQDHLTRITAALQQMKDGELGAIDQFVRHMSFESAREAEPDQLGSVFELVGRALWEAVVQRLPPVAGVPALRLMGIAEAILGEIKKTSATETDFETNGFCVRMAANVTATYQDAIARLLVDGKRDLGLQLAAIQASDPGSYGFCAATGEMARFLSELDDRATAMLKGLPRPVDFEQRFLVEWIKRTRAGGGGDRLSPNGLIRVWFDVEQRAGGPLYRLERAKLLTSHRPGRAAGMLDRIMKERGSSILDTGLTVAFGLHMRIPGKGRRRVWFFSTDPNWDNPHIPDEFRTVWAAMPAAYRQITHVEGGRG